MGDRAYQQCTHCVMDTTATEIEFDEKGVCNFCKTAEELCRTTIFRPKEVREKELHDAVKKIKEIGKNSTYDCLIGLSGGVDSSYLCYWAKQEGLRPLVVHFDNGWNSELAVENIENIISKCGFDLYTYVINWDDFKDLQLSYIKASVVDIEVPTDQLIFSSLYAIAKKYKIKSIINGNNIATESILPRTWFYPDKLDKVNLTEIHKKFGTRALKDFPSLSLYELYINRNLHSMFSVSPLNLLDYDKNEAKKLLMKEFGWRDYGGKHYESIFTRFYQGYILPRKFKIDKRKAHLASLIASKGITREEALEILKEPTYDPELQKSDLEFAIKKFGISEDEFDKYMKMEPIPHAYYGTQWDKKHFRKYFIFTKIAKPIFSLLKMFRAA